MDAAPVDDNGSLDGFELFFEIGVAILRMGRRGASAEDQRRALSGNRHTAG
jgi:hypothetical protein